MDFHSKNNFSFNFQFSIPHLPSPTLLLCTSPNNLVGLVFRTPFFFFPFFPLSFAFVAPYSSNTTSNKWISRHICCISVALFLTILFFWSLCWLLSSLIPLYILHNTLCFLHLHCAVGFYLQSFSFCFQCDIVQPVVSGRPKKFCM